MAARCVVLLAAGCLLAAAPSYAQTTAPRRVALAVDLNLDLGRAQGPQPPALSADWPDRFMPPNDGMRLETARHAWFAEWSVTLEPSMNAGEWRIGLPISMRVAGAAAPSVKIGEYKYARKYVWDQLVSATTLDWWNPVIVSGYSLRQHIPAVGVSLSRGRGVLQVAGRPYELVEQHYSGVDVVDGVNYSKRLSSRRVADGISIRVDAMAQGTSESNPYAFGVFVERAGGDAWKAGIRLRFRMTRLD